MTHFTHDFTIIREEFEFGIEHRPAAATQASVAQSADADGRHVVKSVTVSVATGATASGIISFLLLDGSTVVWSCKLSALINDSKALSVPMNFIGTKNTAITVQSGAAGAATSELAVALTGYTITG